MTTIYQAPQAGPATHAFVIGVGAYPSAKPGGVKASLRNVPDIPSAADSAKLVCDWLVRNRADLAAPLGSLEVLLAPAAPRPGSAPYAWTEQANWTVPATTPILPPDAANVVPAGAAWLGRVKPGDVTFFYICGHGARLGSEAVVFLSDLNANAITPWSHINVVQTAMSFKQQAAPRASFFFVDACQELLPKFEIGDNRMSAALIAPTFDPFEDSREKVALLVATSSGKLAFDGTTPFEDGLPGAPQVKIGRFTQTLLRAFDGASVRLDNDDTWTVSAGDVFTDLRPLYQLRDDWRDKVFDPAQLLAISEVVPIVRPPAPRVPVLVTTDPADHMPRCLLQLFEDPGRAVQLHSRNLGAATAWVVEVSPSFSKHLAVAALHDGEPLALVAEFERPFTPVKPIFDARIRLT